MKTLVLATIPNFDLTNKRRFMSITSLTPFLALICPILLFQGCDFFEPISKQPSHDIDTRLLGKWDAVVGTKADGEEIHYSVTVTKKDSTHYFIQTNIGKAIAWHNTVGSTDFLTIEFKDEPAPYVYVTCATDGNEVHCQRVSEDPDSKFASDKKGTVAQRIKRHLQDKDFLEPYHVYTRVQ